MATRWVTDNAPGHSQRYIERLRQMAAQGQDLAGEARLLDAMLRRGARVLDAGCGPGRVGAHLAARGHTIVGVDADPELIAAAQADHPGPRWLVADLSELDLAAQGQPDPFDAAVLAGNVMPYLAPGTEPLVLARVAAHVHPDGIVVIGFSIDRGYPLEALDAHAEAAGLGLESRFATWDLRPFQPGGDYAVTVFRRPT
jgi:2-polyprenyl-3-methyl-5-hydroxy-6-metoxy-1,4-benzoquinol methylase